MGERAGTDHVDDVAVTAGDEMGQRVLHQKQRTAQVGAVGGLPGFGSDGADWQAQRIGRVVHHDVDPAELVHGAGHQSCEVVVARGVGGDRDGSSARRSDPRGYLFARLGFPARDHDCGATRSEGLGDRLADTAASAGDDRHATSEVELLGDVGKGAHRMSFADGDAVYR